MAVTDFTTLGLPQIVQEYFLKGLVLNLSSDATAFEMIKKNKVSVPPSKSLEFYIQNDRGSAGVQMAASGAGGLPGVHRASGSRKSAFFKTLNATIAVNYDELRRAQESSQNRFGEPLMIEIDSKRQEVARLISKQVWADGTGVLGTVSSSSVVGAASAGKASVVLTETAANLTWGGTIGQFDYGDLLVSYGQAGGSAVTPTVASGTHYAWKVISRDRDTNTVVLASVDSSGTELDVDATGLTAADVFYRIGQPTIADLSSIAADYSTLTENLVGLDTLAAADGRLINGITMSGATKGTIVDCASSALNVSFIQRLMSNIKTEVGQGAAKWDNIVMAPEAIDLLINENEGNRFFNTFEDQKRGTRALFYQHQNDSLEMIYDEYIPKSVAYAIPKAKFDGGRQPLEFGYSDVKMMEVDGKAFQLGISSGEYQKQLVGFMEGYMVLYSAFPATIGKLSAFTL